MQVRQFGSLWREMWRQLHLWIVCGVHNQGRRRRPPKINDRSCGTAGIEPHESAEFRIRFCKHRRWQIRHLRNRRVFLAGQTTRFGSVQKGALFGFLEALKKEGVVRVLSDPTICTVSGRPVHFHCGGEIPILSKQVVSSPTIEYKKYGTQIDCVPILREDQSVRLEINTRLSELDPSRDVTIGETRVPGLRVREFDTAGEVKPGQR